MKNPGPEMLVKLWKERLSVEGNRRKDFGLGLFKADPHFGPPGQTGDVDVNRRDLKEAL